MIYSFSTLWVNLQFSDKSTYRRSIVYRVIFLSLYPCFGRLETHYTQIYGQQADFKFPLKSTYRPSTVHPRNFQFAGPCSTGLKNLERWFGAFYYLGNFSVFEEIVRIRRIKKTFSLKCLSAWEVTCDQKLTCGIQKLKKGVSGVLGPIRDFFVHHEYYAKKCLAMG